MLRLPQLLNIRGNAGDPLPVVWDSLKGSRFLRGQLCLICAGPGTGKSAFALTYALKAKVPTLYFSADSDAFTQLSRSLSILKGWSTEKADKAVREKGIKEIEAELWDIPIHFECEANPTLKRIETSMAAFAEVTDDRYPDLVVVDNVTNVIASPDDDDPFSNLEALMDYLHKMARDTGSCVVGLHHVQGQYNNGSEPIPLGGIKGQIGRVPELVLTMHRVASEFGPDTLNVSTVKNRGGKMDPSGQDFVSLEFIGNNMQIREFGR